MTPQTFGEKLRREREKRRITLQQLATRTKISANLLKSLEQGDCARWPGGIYSRAFVRAYAQAIGLDPEETVALFAECYPAFAAQPDPVEEPQPDETALEKVRAVIAALFSVTAETRR